MTLRPSAATLSKGFTLTELAIVLVIMSLLIGGMLVPLSAQRDIQKASETQKQLSEIKEALFGFAIINGRLPCPTTQTDPANANYGIEDAACVSVEGYLPWKTLGVPETDAWGTIRSASSDPYTGYWRYRADNSFSAVFVLGTPTTSALLVQDAAGNDLTQVANSPVAVIYSTGPDLVANGRNATLDTTYQAGERSPIFDDVTLWIGRPILLNRLVTAGRLP